MSIFGGDRDGFCLRACGEGPRWELDEDGVPAVALGGTDCSFGIASGLGAVVFGICNPGACSGDGGGGHGVGPGWNAGLGPGGYAGSLGAGIFDHTAIHKDRTEE